MYLRFVLILLVSFLTACSTTNTQPAITNNANSVLSTNNLPAAGLNVQLGVTYLQQGNPALAKPKLLLALQQAPDWPPALDAMAYYLETTGDSVAAEKYYQQALSISPKDGSANNNYGTFLCRAKRYPEALHTFEQAIADPNYLNAANAYENAGMCATDANNTAAARKYYEHALLLNPNSSIALLGLAKLAYQRQDDSLAQHYLSAYQKTGASDPEALTLADQIATKLR